MKNLILLIACLFMWSCSDSSSDSSSESYPHRDASADTPEELAPVEDEPIKEPVALALLEDGNLYFYNGDFVLQENVNPVICGNRCFTDGNLKVFYDAMGETESQEYIAIEPDFILDEWVIENIDPQTALSMGAMAKDYTKIYFDGVELGFWFLNQYKAVDLIKTNSGEIIVIDENSGYHVLTSVIENINHAKDLIIYDFDPISRTAMIDGDFVSWTANYFNQAKEWQKSGNVWYSWNGYEYNMFLSEYANSMQSWNSVNILGVSSPTLLSAGTRLENSETVLYWVECNSGWLIKYIPSIDLLTPFKRLYQGNGERMTGVFNRANLKPVLIDGDLYFYESGSVWKLGIGSGIVELFFAGEGEVLMWN